MQGCILFLPQVAAQLLKAPHEGVLVLSVVCHVTLRRRETAGESLSPAEFVSAGDKFKMQVTPGEIDHSSIVALTAPTLPSSFEMQA